MYYLDMNEDSVFGGTQEYDIKKKSTLFECQCI